jgi:hypothetical protein
LPFVDDPVLRPLIVLRSLRLNCLTVAYADLWAQCFSDVFVSDAWTGGIDYAGRAPLGAAGTGWTAATPLRRAVDRRQALLELDVLVAMSLGITIDELCTIYRTQFPVLYGYDRERDFYDAEGRVVPNSVLTVWRRKGDATTREERTAIHSGSGIAYEYALPFRTLDREADLRHAHTEFTRRLETAT